MGLKRRGPGRKVWREGSKPGVRGKDSRGNTRERRRAVCNADALLGSTRGTCSPHRPGIYWYACGGRFPVAGRGVSAACAAVAVCGTCLDLAPGIGPRAALSCGTCWEGGQC